MMFLVCFLMYNFSYPVSYTQREGGMETERTVPAFPQHLWDKIRKPCGLLFSTVWNNQHYQVIGLGIKVPTSTRSGRILILCRQRSVCIIILRVLNTSYPTPDAPSPQRLKKWHGPDKWCENSWMCAHSMSTHVHAQTEGLRPKPHTGYKN